MAELVFEVVQEADGGYCAKCLTESIFSRRLIHGTISAEISLKR
jgi:hypothetical protein